MIRCGFETDQHTGYLTASDLRKFCVIRSIHGIQPGKLGATNFRLPPKKVIQPRIVGFF